MKRSLAPAALAAALAVALAMAILRPVPHGHRYDLAVQLAAGLSLIWLFTRVPLRTAFSRTTLATVFVLGLGLGIVNFASIDPGAETIGYYRSAFEAIDRGDNPYTCGTIFHRAEGGTPAYGNFNYPPVELYPYYVAYRIAGRWDVTVFTAAMMVINGLACAVILLTWPSAGISSLAAFFPLLLFGEIKTNPSLTLLAATVLVWLIVRERRRPSRSGPYFIALAFGVGLMTKFLIWPLAAAYFSAKLLRKGRGRLGPAIGGGALAMGTSALIMAPFGIGAVLKSTVLFNTVLRDRAVLTTFYPNVLSGPLKALGLEAVYPIAAAAAVGAAVLAAPRLRLLPALLLAAFVFLFAAPTPEPQFLPVVLSLALASRCLEKDEGAESETGQLRS